MLSPGLWRYEGGHDDGVDSPGRATCIARALLIGLTAIEATEASLRSVFRFIVRSWDNPATQLFDELVCESSPPGYVGAEVHQSTRLAVRVSHPPASDSGAPRPESPALSSGITRSPPAA